MIRKHATWMGIHPRSATFVSRFVILNFGEVYHQATIRCCVRCWGPFGLAQLLGGRGGRGATALPVDPRFCLTSLGDTARSTSRPYQLVATSATAPVVWGRWQVLGAAFRRAIASRKAVPADIKDQTSRPLRGKTEIVCHIPPPNASGDFGKLMFCARARRGYNLPQRV